MTTKEISAQRDAERHGARRARSIPAEERVAYRPHELVDVLGIGRSKIFSMLKSGELKSLRIGRSRVIPASAVRALLEHEAA